MQLLKRVSLLLCLAGIASVMFWAITGKWLANGLKPEADGKYDYAVVLGAKVNGEVPSLSLQYRLDAALAYAVKHTHVQVVLSGGQGPGEDISEAEAMRRYLVDHGVSEDRLILEDESTSTYENLQLSFEKIPEEVEQITIISSDYHLARAKYLAAKLGVEADVVVAQTPEVVERKLRLRERLALLKTVILGH